MIVVTCHASVYTLVLMSLDRFLAVVHPISSISVRTYEYFLSSRSMSIIIYFPFQTMERLAVSCVSTETRITSLVSISAETYTFFFFFLFTDFPTVPSLLFGSLLPCQPSPLVYHTASSNTLITKMKLTQRVYFWQTKVTITQRSR